MHTTCRLWPPRDEVNDISFVSPLVLLYYLLLRTCKWSQSSSSVEKLKSWSFDDEGRSDNSSRWTRGPQATRRCRSRTQRRWSPDKSRGHGAEPSRHVAEERGVPAAPGFQPLPGSRMFWNYRGGWETRLTLASRWSGNSEFFFLNVVFACWENGGK